MAALLAAMVLGLAGASWGQQGPDQGAVKRATEEARRIAREVYGSSCDVPNARAILEREPKVNVQTGALTLGWNGAYFAFWLATGEPRFVAIHGPVKEGKPIDLGTAREAALRAFEVITGRKDGQVMECPAEDLALASGQYRFEIAPVIDGIPYDGSSTIYIGANTGTPETAYIGREPKIRHTDQPIVDRLQVARDLHANLARLGAFPRERWGDVKLVWAVPSFSSWPNEMGPEHISAEAAGEAIPLYSAAVFDADTWIPELRCSRLVVTAWVDAVTGKTIAMRWADVTPVLERQCGQALKAVALLPPFPGSETSLSIAGQRKPVASAAIEPCEAPKFPTEGVVITLVSGRDAWNVRFDRKSGLVWMDAGGKRVYGRPNAPLLKALEKVKPTKLAPFGKAKLAKAG